MECAADHDVHGRFFIQGKLLQIMLSKYDFVDRQLYQSQSPACEAR